MTKPKAPKLNRFRVEFEREDDGRWIADLLDVPGCMAYGRSPEVALVHSLDIALSLSKPRARKKVKRGK